MRKTAIIGGGAAGCFMAIRLKELVPDMEVVVFEKQNKLLAKVEITGGGRCNCTNSFEGVTDLSQVYPRGARLLKRLFRQFDHEDAYRWFEDHGVRLVTQEDHCVFPAAQDSHVIMECLTSEMRRLGVKVRLGIDGFSAIDGFDFVAITTGGMSRGSVSRYSSGAVIPPLPSLFTLNIADKYLTSLMGTVADNAIVSVPGTKIRTQGPLLITHWGMSGPAILKLSSHAARLLAEHDYKMPLAVNWTGESNMEEVRESVAHIVNTQGQKLIGNVRPCGLSSRLWDYLVGKSGLDVSSKRWNEVGKKQMNRLLEIMTNDQYVSAGRCHYKEEFVTCGGISLDSIDKNTLEAKAPILLCQTKEESSERIFPRIFLAGEVLDIDGVTGGFNLQAAWTTAFAAAEGIAKCV